jgi:hypothetical protein
MSLAKDLNLALPHTYIKTAKHCVTAVYFICGGETCSEPLYPFKRAILAVFTVSFDTQET